MTRRVRKIVVAGLAFVTISLHVTVVATADESQHFEGCITYNIELKSKTPESMPVEILLEHFGTSIGRCYQGGNYRWIYTGGETSDVWYLWRKGKEYWKQRNEQTVKAIDVTVPRMEPAQVETVAGQQVVLGRTLHGVASLPI